MIKNKGFKSVHAGALGKELLGVPINEDYLIKLADYLDKAMKWFRQTDVQACINKGRYCYKIKELAPNQFKELLERYVLPENQNYSDVERSIQEWTQMYRFNHRKGIKLRTDIPKDSYLKILSTVQSIKSKREQNKLLFRANSCDDLDGVSLKNTKALRVKLKEIKERASTSKCPATQAGIYDAEIKNTLSQFNHYASGLKTATNKLQELAPKGNSDFYLNSSSVKQMEDFLSFISNDLETLKSNFQKLLKTNSRKIDDPLGIH